MEKIVDNFQLAWALVFVTPVPSSVYATETLPINTALSRLAPIARCGDPTSTPLKTARLVATTNERGAINRWIESGLVDFTETRGGQLLVCVPSLSLGTVV